VFVIFLNDHEDSLRATGLSALACWWRFGNKTRHGDVVTSNDNRFSRRHFGDHVRQVALCMLECDWWHRCRLLSGHHNANPKADTNGSTCLRRLTPAESDGANDSPTARAENVLTRYGRSHTLLPRSPCLRACKATRMTSCRA